MGCATARRRVRTVGSANVVNRFERAPTWLPSRSSCPPGRTAA